jgi:MFS family permease
LNYAELFKNHKVVKDLSLLQLLVYFATWFSNVAIYTMLVEFGSSELAIATVTAMHFLPAIFIAVLSGAIIDRFNIKKLMYILMFVELSMTLLFLTIDKPSEIWLLMLFIFIRMSASSMFFSTEMSLLSKLLSGQALQRANEIHSIIWSLTYALGMAISALVVNAYGVTTAFIIDACMFVFALLLLMRIHFEVQANEYNHKIKKLIVDGFNYIKNHKLIFRLIILHASVGLTSFDTLVTLLAKNEYKYVIAVPLAIGLSNATRAVGLMIGPFILSKFTNKDSLYYLLILQGITIIFWGLVQENFYLALFAQFTIGLFTTTLWSFTYALLQENCEKEYIGRVVSYNDMFFMISCAGTTFLIGILANYVSLATITIILGIGFILFATYYKGLLKWI